MKRIHAVAIALTMVMPLFAQRHQADHDKPVAGGGTLPAGWKGRLDSGGGRSPVSK